jgi:hypothetical protein
LGLAKMSITAQWWRWLKRCHERLLYEHWTWTSCRRIGAHSCSMLHRTPQNGDLLCQRKNPGRLCMLNTPCVLRILNFYGSQLKVHKESA